MEITLKTVVEVLFAKEFDEDFVVESLNQIEAQHPQFMEKVSRLIGEFTFRIARKDIASIDLCPLSDALAFYLRCVNSTMSAEFPDFTVGDMAISLAKKETRDLLALESSEELGERFNQNLALAMTDKEVIRIVSEELHQAYREFVACNHPGSETDIHNFSRMFLLILNFATAAFQFEEPSRRRVAHTP